MAEIDVPLIHTTEQRRIATRVKAQLAEVETARIAAEAQLQNANMLSLAYSREVFEGFKAKTWPVVSLGQAGEVVSGITLGRKTNSRAMREIPYLRVANVKYGLNLDLAEVKTVEATVAGNR